MIRQTAYKDFAEGVVGLKEELAYVQTNDGTPQPLAVITLPSDARGFVIVTMLAADVGGSTHGLVGRKMVHWKTVAGTASVVDSVDIVPDNLEGLTTATWAVDASGGNIRIVPTGEAMDIDWYALYDNNYITLSPP
jgi:hypothetical protein